MAIQLFNEEEDISLKEYSEDSNYEDYAGIVLDRDKNQFKVVTGKFTDKKDFYNKMADRGLILRKCFEIRVYNWIKENARTTLDAYLMLSTAFSKWKGNNMLSSYYNKLLKDIPELNREGQKGNPNTRGKKEEAVLEEDGDSLDTASLSYEDIKGIFQDTTVDDAYLKALAVKDPMASAIALEKVYEGYNPKYISDYSGGTFINRAYNVAKDINKSQEDRYTDTMDIDVEGLYDYNRKLRNRGIPYYNITMTPVIGKTTAATQKDVSNNTKNTYWIELGKRLTNDTKTLNNIAISNIDGGKGSNLSLINFLKNPVFYNEIRDFALTEQNKLDRLTDGEKLVGMILNIYSDKNTNITPNIANNFTSSQYVTAFDQNGETFGDKVLPLNQGLKDDGFFVSLSQIFSWYKKLQADKDLSSFTKTDSRPDILNKARYNLKQRPETQGERRDEAGKVMYARALISRLEKDFPDSPYIVNHKQQKQIIADKLKDIQYAEKNGPRGIKIAEVAKKALASIASVVDADYFENMIQFTPFNNYIKGVDKKQYEDETEQSIRYANIGKFTQNAAAYDKLAKIEDMRKNGIHITNKNIKSSTKTKDTIDKKEKEPEVSKEERLLNAISRFKNGVNYWSYRAKNARGKDKEEAEKQITKNREALEKALADYDEFAKNNQSSGVINPNATGEVNVDEAYVNDGATGYYQDQQSAAKNALAGSFIAEEITHSELNPVLFDGETLKPDVLDAFLMIADTFKQTLNISIDPVDVYFTGSNANYNYNESSDIDIHLVYDFEQVGIAAEILEKYLRDAKRLFNLDYDEIRVKGIKVEVGYENIATPLVATAVYSLRNNNWVKKPNMKATEIKDPDIEAYNDITSRIETAIQDKDLNALEALWKEIGELRKQSLNLEGEFGQGNALFKKLRNLGAIGRLRNAYYQAASKDLSLESNGANIDE